MNNLEYLLEGYLNDRLSETELEAFMALVDREETDFPDVIRGLLDQHTVAGLGNVELRDRLFSQMMQRAREEKTKPAPVKRMYKLRWVVAAAVLIMISMVTFFWMQQKHDASIADHPTGNDALPGKQGAVLTLANGSSIVLDTLNNGMIAQEPGARVLLKDGQLAYHAESSTAVGYNTMTTPKGRQFSLVLPDGSKVWLNAASSLRYPTAFTGNERIVEVTGEAYFEIVSLPLSLPQGRDKLSGGGGKGKMPFKVLISSPGGQGRAAVEVLGTHFNVNAYDDESTIKTTLLEGSVKATAIGPVNRREQSAMLEPGQQAVIAVQSSKSNESSQIQVQTVDVKKVMAWKNGLFQFDNADLKTVMRQLARWYDVEVVFERGAPVQEVFYGEMQRTLKLSQVLKILGSMQVHFRIEDGKRVIVTP